MKIVLVNTLYEPYAIGGAEFSTKILAEGLAEEHSVYVITAGLKNEIKRKNGVIVVYKKIPHIFNRYYGNRKSVITKAAWRLYEYVNRYPYYLFKAVFKKINPDIVHTNNIAMFTPRIWKAASEFAKVVHTTRDYYLICARSSMMKGGTNECEGQCRFCKNYTHKFRDYRSYVDEFVFISEYVKKQHQKYYEAEGSVIYNAIGKIQVETQNSSEIKKDTDFVLGYIGLISKVKGVDRVIEVANKLKIPTVLAGDIAAGENDLRNTMKESDYITYLGFTDQEIFFNKIDLLLHLPRWNEPMGRTIVEAFAFGKPVITLNKGGLKDLVTHQVDGFYVDENDFLDQIRNIVIDLKDNPERYSEISSVAQETAQKFSTQNYISNYIDIYR